MQLAQEIVLAVLITNKFTIMDKFYLILACIFLLIGVSLLCEGHIVFSLVFTLGSFCSLIKGGAADEYDKSRLEIFSLSCLVKS